MTAETVDETRTPMSWEDYEALDGSVRGEYFGGHFVVVGNPNRRHQRIARDLSNLIEPTMPDRAEVSLSWGWSPAGIKEELRPDLMVHTSDEDRRLTSSLPLLVVEVLSSNRRNDLVDKMFRYAHWGAPTYWVVDPRDHELVVHVLHGDVYAVAEVHTGGIVHAAYAGTTVEIDLDHLLR